MREKEEERARRRREERKEGKDKLTAPFEARNLDSCNINRPLMLMTRMGLALMVTAAAAASPRDFSFLLMLSRGAFCCSVTHLHKSIEQ